MALKGLNFKFYVIIDFSGNIKMLTKIALFSIRLYQKFISQHKGFSCAYRLATHETSCSGYGAKVIKRWGIFTGYKLLNRRFYDCRWHAQNSFKTVSRKSLSGQLKYQAGFVDCDCGGCDAPDISSCDTPDCSPGIDDCFPDDCGKSKNNQSPSFVEKRDNKNEKKQEKFNGINLNKSDNYKVIESRGKIIGVTDFGEIDIQTDTGEYFRHRILLEKNLVVGTELMIKYQNNKIISIETLSKI